MQTVLFYGVPQGCSFGAIVALEWLQQPYYLSRVEMLDQRWDFITCTEVIEPRFVEEILS